MSTDNKCTIIDIVRKPKVFGMAAFDWTASLLAAFMVGKLIRINTVSQWTVFLLFWVMFGVAVHYVLGVPTMLGYYLGLNPMPTQVECLPYEADN